MVSKYLIPLLAIMATGSLSYTIPLEPDLFIKYPNNQTEWRAGERHHVVWQYKDPKTKDKSGVTAPLSLVSPSYRYNLSDHVNLAEGRTSVTVPKDVVPGEYEVLLDVREGRYSPKFIIQKKL